MARADVPERQPLDSCIPATHHDMVHDDKVTCAFNNDGAAQAALDARNDCFEAFVNIVSIKISRLCFVVWRRTPAAATLIVTPRDAASGVNQDAKWKQESVPP